MTRLSVVYLGSTPPCMRLVWVSMDIRQLPSTPEDLHRLIGGTHHRWRAFLVVFHRFNVVVVEAPVLDARVYGVHLVKQPLLIPVAAASPKVIVALCQRRVCMCSGPGQRHGTRAWRAASPRRAQASYPMRTVGLNFVREKSARRLLQLMLLGRTCTWVGRLFLSCEAATKVFAMLAVPAPGGTGRLIPLFVCAPKGEDLPVAGVSRDR